jgi:hypothetical protein
LQREILYRGSHQVSIREGKGLLAECELWIETCRVALQGVSRNRVEAPWSYLHQAAKLVDLEGDAWARVIEATFGMSSDEDWEKVMTEVIGECDLSREDVTRVLRSREDCDR